MPRILMVRTMWTKWCIQCSKMTSVPLLSHFSSFRRIEWQFKSPCIQSSHCYGPFLCAFFSSFFVKTNLWDDCIFFFFTRQNCVWELVLKIFNSFWTNIECFLCFRKFEITTSFVSLCVYEMKIFSLYLHILS